MCCQTVATRCTCIPNTKTGARTAQSMWRMMTTPPIHNSECCTFAAVKGTWLWIGLTKWQLKKWMRTLLVLMSQQSSRHQSRPTASCNQPTNTKQKSCCKCPDSPIHCWVKPKQPVCLWTLQPFVLRGSFDWLGWVSINNVYKLIWIFNGII